MLIEHPYYVPGEIPAGAYPGVDAVVQSLAVMNWVIAMESLDGETLYVADESGLGSLRVDGDSRRKIEVAGPFPALNWAIQHFSTTKARLCFE